MDNPLASLISNIRIESGALSLILLFFAIFYIGISSILFYHWRKYGMKNRSIVLAELIFALVSIFLFYLAGVGIAIF